MLFTAFAAPLQFYLDWYSGYRDSHQLVEAMALSLLGGILYFYSVTVSAEAYLRVDTHPELDPKDGINYGIKILCIPPFIAFMFEYLIHGYRNPHPDQQALWSQVWLALYSFGVTSISHYKILQSEEIMKKRSRSKS